MDVNGVLKQIVFDCFRSGWTSYLFGGICAVNGCVMRPADLREILALLIVDRLQEVT